MKHFEVLRSKIKRSQTTYEEYPQRNENIRAQPTQALHETRKIATKTHISYMRLPYSSTESTEAGRSMNILPVPVGR